jgi:hypothetical protein
MKEAAVETLNSYCVELLKRRIQELGKQRLVAIELGASDGAISKWKNEQQEIESKYVGLILVKYGKLPVEIIKKVPPELFEATLRFELAYPGFLEAATGLFATSDKEKIEHWLRQAKLLSRRD